MKTAIRVLMNQTVSPVLFAAACALLTGVGISARVMVADAEATIDSTMQILQERNPENLARAISLTLSRELVP